VEISRTAYKSLLTWKDKPSRKALLIRGARQVGKTYLVRKLGKEFKQYIEINFVEDARLRSLFTSGSLDPNKILDGIAAYLGQPIIDGEALLFIDEIQACPEAITALRFFYEKRPNLHVIATGSLLEFALEEIASFGVGRIEYLYLYPLTFREFLRAQGEDLLLGLISKATHREPLHEILHTKTLSLLKIFLQLGGLPEIHSQYLTTKDFVTCFRLLSTLLTSYQDDFSKYRNRLSTEALSATFKSTAIQTGKKFIYSHAYRDANIRTVSLALELLLKAGVIHKIHHTSANGAPLGAEIDINKFKVMPLDLGIFNQLNGLHLSELATVDPLHLINKGTLAEAYTGLEILHNAASDSKWQLYYWHREAKSSNAELDYVVEIDHRVVPIEVKASSKGAMRSMHLFLKEKKVDIGIRVSTENFSKYGDVYVVPLYAVSEIGRIVREDS
jgi:predicted AAA+ superfamily ATPase